MSPSITRRHALFGLLIAPSLVAWTRQTTPEVDSRLAEIEKGSGGRLGVATLDTQTGARVRYRADDRFPMCSTFKWLAAAAILERVDRGLEHLDRRVPFGVSDLLEYAPVTTARVGEGSMPLADLCEAAITVSDNTAGNLLLGALGGPSKLTAYTRLLGDRMTRLDRTEPTLNEAAPGDPRDTTTPAAMVADLDKLILGNALSAASREQLLAWLVAATRGAARLPAGLPADWRIGHKAGTGSHGTTNDVAIVYPPGRRPFLIAAYLTGADADDAARDAVLASVARVIVHP